MSCKFSTQSGSPRPETASRLRGRIERILDFAKAKGWRFGENPALWRGHLRNVLPMRSKLSKGHQPAMPYRQVPDFMVRLRNSEAMATKAWRCFKAPLGVTAPFRLRAFLSALK